jgi:hypothetical protein
MDTNLASKVCGLYNCILYGYVTPLSSLLESDVLRGKLMKKRWLDVIAWFKFKMFGNSAVPATIFDVK